MSLADWDYAKPAMDRATDALRLHSLGIHGDPLETPYWGRYCMYRNDADGRTVEQVLSVLDRVVGYAREQEKSALNLNASGDLLIQYDIDMMNKLNLPISGGNI